MPERRRGGQSFMLTNKVCELRVLILNHSSAACYLCSSGQLFICSETHFPYLLNGSQNTCSTMHPMIVYVNCIAQSNPSVNNHYNYTGRFLQILFIWSWNTVFILQALAGMCFLRAKKLCILRLAVSSVTWFLADPYYLRSVPSSSPRADLDLIGPENLSEICPVSPCIFEHGIFDCQPLLLAGEPEICLICAHIGSIPFYPHSTLQAWRDPAGLGASPQQNHTTCLPHSSSFRKQFFQMLYKQQNSSLDSLIQMLSLIHLQDKTEQNSGSFLEKNSLQHLSASRSVLSLHMEVSASLPHILYEHCLVNCSESKSGWNIYPEQIMAGCIPMSTCAMLISYKIVHYSVGHKQYYQIDMIKASESLISI